jgi:hypothetical protein
VQLNTILTIQFDFNNSKHLLSLIIETYIGNIFPLIIHIDTSLVSHCVTCHFLYVNMILVCICMHFQLCFDFVIVSKHRCSPLHMPIRPETILAIYLCITFLFARCKVIDISVLISHLYKLEIIVWSISYLHHVLNLINLNKMALCVLSMYTCTMYCIHLFI